jgi:hypothetical protein
MGHVADCQRGDDVVRLWRWWRRKRRSGPGRRWRWRDIPCTRTVWHGRQPSTKHWHTCCPAHDNAATPGHRARLDACSCSCTCSNAFPDTCAHTRTNASTYASTSTRSHGQSTGPR